MGNKSVRFFIIGVMVGAFSFAAVLESARMKIRSNHYLETGVNHELKWVPVDSIAVIVEEGGK